MERYITITSSHYQSDDLQLTIKEGSRNADSDIGGVTRCLDTYQTRYIIQNKSIFKDILTKSVYEMTPDSDKDRIILCQTLSQ